MGILGRFPGMDLEQVQDPVARRNFKTLERILMRAAIGDNALGSGGITNIGGIPGGGGDFDLNQVKENEVISDSTKGLLGFGKGDVDGLAHAFNVSADGEVRIAELPPVIVSASGASNDKPFGFAFASQIFTTPRANREANGSSPSNYSILNVGQFHDFNLGSNEGESSTDADVGLLTMDSPKVQSRRFAEFEGDYYSGGTPGVAKAMDSGSHSTNTSLAVFRFRRGVITFQTSKTGTPPDTLRVLLIGRPTSGAAGAVILKAWQFHSDSWLGSDAQNGQALYFDVETSFLAISIAAVGGANDAGNHFTIDASTFYVNLIS